MCFYQSPLKCLVQIGNIQSIKQGYAYINLVITLVVFCLYNGIHHVLIGKFEMNSTFAYLSHLSLFPFSQEGSVPFPLVKKDFFFFSNPLCQEGLLLPFPIPLNLKVFLFFFFSFFFFGSFMPCINSLLAQSGFRCQKNSPSHWFAQATLDLSLRDLTRSNFYLMK